MAGAALLSIAGCNEPRANIDQPLRQPPAGAQNAARTAPEGPPQLLLDGNGLIFADADGTNRSLAFGSAASGAIAAVRQVYGDPQKTETLEECGAGPLQVSNFSGLTLAAQDGKFTGWWLNAEHTAPLPETTSGIGIGSPRAALQKAYSIETLESSLGHEFVTNGIAGLTSSEDSLAKITHLWAGSTCIMR